MDIIKDNLCKSENITLIRLKENNRKYIQDIKSQLIENLEVINKICDENFNNNDIMNIDDLDINEFVNSEIIDEKKIIGIISKYDNYHDFKINELSLYQKLIKRGLIYKYTSELKRDFTYWNEKKILNEIKKYESLKELIKKSPNCYNYIMKNKLYHFVENLDKNLKLSEFDIVEEIKKYEYLKDFREKSPNYYGYILKYKLHYLIKGLKVTKNRKPDFSISEIKSEIEKYEFLKDFEKNSSKHFRFVKRHHLHDLTKDLKRNKPLYSISEIKSEIDKYEYLKDFREKSNSHYRHIQYHKLTDLIEYSKKLK